jgi:Xaa-Pro aminopeptidase
MFQSLFLTFDEIADPSQGALRAGLLREALHRRGLDGFVIPRSDEHQNEYVAPASERLRWLTGFSGSAGLCIVLADRAAIFVDGRYTLQIREQVDPKVFDPQHLIESPPEGWIERNLKAGAKLGYDPWLLTPSTLARLERAAAKVGAKMVAVSPNPIDEIWAERPAPPLAAVHLQAKHLAGVDSDAKIARVQQAIEATDGLIVSDPHAVAWLFNIRGGDVGHTPLPLSFALLPRHGRPTLYMDARKLSNAVRDQLMNLADIAEPDALLGDIERLGKAGAKVLFDAATVPARLTQALQDAGGHAEVASDPIALMKAAKNRTELAGIRKAHSRDAAAVAAFLAWFDAESKTGKLSEIGAVEALETFRRRSGKLKDVAFASIAGSGAHAAIPHYRVTRQSDQPIGKGLFLIDSGAQYEDGTTDITRTIAVGRPSAEMRDRFTRVLKGHIAIARLVFPKGVSGAQLDAFARQALWEAGLDFDHGTGHGVGAYLSVHEGPQRLAKTGTVPLAEGMILSNEPGYYKPGHWGIRIENLIVVEKRRIAGAERIMFGFETISFAPIDLRLIQSKLLSEPERDWLNAYHARVRKTVAPLVDPSTRRWLAAATRPIKRP